MSLHKLEQWEVAWYEGRRRSRRFADATEARAAARAVEREKSLQAGVRRVDRWRVRWREGGRGSRNRQKTFARKGDAERFEREVRRRKDLGELALWEKRNRPVRELALEWWEKHAKPNLAETSLDQYEYVLTRHIEPRVGALRVGEFTPEVAADFRSQLERASVGRITVRTSMVVLQAMFAAAVRWGWVPTNPVHGVPKPSPKRARAVVCLAPSQVEAIRNQLIAKDKLYAATIVGLVAYEGLRVPEEVLALEVRHVGGKTLLVEQRLIKGRIVAGQKVRHFRPRAVPLEEPVRLDLAEYLMATGIRSGPLFPREDGDPWRPHDYKNWARRVWHPTCRQAKIERLRPYDLRHAYASLQIRAGLSIPELAERLGHSPQMTVMTYTHVIRELEGELRVSAEEQIERARRDRKAKRAVGH
jgi:integrase